jgi:hypothetical protein
MVHPTAYELPAESAATPLKALAPLAVHETVRAPLAGAAEARTKEEQTKRESRARRDMADHLPR